MRVSSIVMGLLIVGVLGVGIYSFANDLAKEQAYDIEVSGQYLVVFNKTNDLTKDINKSYAEIQTKLQSDNSGYIITLVPQTIILMKNAIIFPFKAAGEILIMLVEYMKLPTWVQAFFIAAIALIFLFSMVALVLRYKYT